jgi:hypothetical protein
MSNTILLSELICWQRNNLKDDLKLKLKDIKRISKFLNKSMFGDECSIWDGYMFEKSKFTIFFFFNNHKHNLLKLCYYNFIGEFNPKKEYLISVCNTKKCCNITHYKKCYKYHRKKKNKNKKIITYNQKKSLTIIFD